MKTKIQPGITIDKDLWEEFKAKFENSSEEIERLMKLDMQSEVTDLTSLPCSSINSMTIPTNNWSISYSNSNMYWLSSDATTMGNILIDLKKD